MGQAKVQGFTCVTGIFIKAKECCSRLQASSSSEERVRMRLRDLNLQKNATSLLQEEDKVKWLATIPRIEESERRPWDASSDEADDDDDNFEDNDDDDDDDNDDNFGN